jgi:hypothetical protein
MILREQHGAMKGEGKVRPMTTNAAAEERVYTSTFAGKGARIGEARAALRMLAAGRTIDAVRKAVVEENVLDAGTRSSRGTAWREIHRRYISGRTEDHVRTLAHLVTHCPSTPATNLVLFYEYCQADPLLYDLTADCTHALYHQARAVISKVDVDAWLRAQEAAHPEVAAWTPSTRQRLVSGYLSTIRDFGLVEGHQRKSFRKLYVPREAFVYALYDQRERRTAEERMVTPKALIAARDWRLFLLREEDVIFLLDDAAQGGFVHFRRAGDIYDLRFVYASLQEVVDALVS